MTSTLLQISSSRRAAVSAFAGAVALLGAAGAQAQDSSFLPDGVSGTIVLATDYVDAGFSQTAGHMAAQGGLQWAHESGVYVGFWASNVDFGSDDPVVAEVAVSAGRAGDLDFLHGTIGYDFAVTYNIYPRKKTAIAANIDREFPADVATDLPPDASIPVNPDTVASDYEFLELTGELTRESAVGTWSFSAAYSPNIPGHTGQALAAAVGLATLVTDKLSASAAVQKSWMPADAGADYIDWNAGLTYSTGVVDLDLRYHQAQDKACDGGCPARFVFSLIKEF